MSLFTILFDIFLSIIPLFLLVIAKIYFNKKFSNKAFFISLIILTIISVSIFYFAFLLSWIHNYPLSLGEKIYCCSIPLVCGNCDIFVYFCLFFIPVLFIASLLYFIKTKNKKVIKKFLISLLFLLPFIYISYPFFVLNFDKKYNRYGKNEYKYLADKCILPQVKAFGSEMLVRTILNSEIQEKFGNRKTGNYDLSSDEAKSDVDEFVKYLKMDLKYSCYLDFDSIMPLILYKRFDDALELIEIAEDKLKTGMVNLRLKLYFAQKDYQKALEFAQKTKFNRKASEYGYYMTIYTGLKEFDKAYEYYDKCITALNSEDSAKYSDNFCNKGKIYLDYKAGNTELAQKEYAEWISYPKEMSLDEYITYLVNSYIY